MQADEESLFARIAQVRTDLCSALDELDQAVADCNEAKRELTDLLAVVERAGRGDLEALKQLPPHWEA